VFLENNVIKVRSLLDNRSLEVVIDETIHLIKFRSDIVIHTDKVKYQINSETQNGTTTTTHATEA